MTDDTLRFRDFSPSPEPITFRIAPDTFRCYPEIPLDVMMDVVRMSQSQATGLDRFDQLIKMLEGVIEPLDYDLFIKRTKRGTKEEPNPNPIGMRQIREMLPWVMEVYGLRPTQASSESPAGSSDASTSSTELASAEASTS